MNNIILTGFAGTGKTTIGKRLAEQLQLPFADMDWLIAERQGRTIPEIFATEGESFFRSLETALCQEITQWKGYVVSTGGGTLVKGDNLALVEPNNLVICLDTDPEILWQRLSFKQDRPLLNAKDTDEKKTKLLNLFAERQAAYARIPHHIDTSRHPINIVVDEIAAVWRNKTQWTT